MATVPGVNSLVRVRIGCFAFNQAAINTVHFQVESTTGVVNTADIAEALDVILAPLYKPALSAKALYYGVSVQCTVGAVWSVASVASTRSGVGTAGDTPLPLQTCGVISSQAAFAGAKFRGRVYIPFPDHADQDPLTNTPAVLYNGKLAAIAPVIYEPKEIAVGIDTLVMEPKIGPRGDVESNDIVSWRVRDKWATQRRRGNYGAANTYPPF